MKILGIDYGRKKIGVAIGDTTTKLAEPLQVWSISNIKYQISKTIRDNFVEKIIIGLPNGKLDEKIKRFGGDLEKQIGVKVEFFDETLTTQDAQQLLIISGRKRKLRKEKEDAVAAAIMLQYYLEGRDNDD